MFVSREEIEKCGLLEPKPMQINTPVEYSIWYDDFYSENPFYKNNKGSYLAILDSCPNPKKLVYDGKVIRDCYGFTFDVQQYKVIKYTKYPV